MPDPLDAIWNGTPATAPPVDDLSALWHGSDAPPEKSVMGFLGNTLHSAGSLVGNLASAVVHPQQTAASVVGLGGGLLSKGVRKVAESVMGESLPPSPEEVYPDALGKVYADRYGSGEKALNTLYKDPVGVAADAATVLGGAGVIGKAGLAPRLGKALSTVADVVDPISAAAKIADNTVVPLLQPALVSGAKKLVSGTMKVKPTVQKQNRLIDIPEVILEERLAPTQKGFDKAKDLIDTLSDEVSTRITKTDLQGKKFALQPLMDELDKLERDYLHSPNGDADVAAVQKAKDMLMNHPLYSKEVQVPQTTQVPSKILGPSGQPVMTSQTTMVPAGRRLLPQTAEEIDVMKKNVYSGLKGKYGKEQGAVLEADKGEGRALKGILDANVPGVKAINERQSGIIAAKNALEDAAIRSNNRFPLSFHDVQTGAIAAAKPSIFTLPLLLSSLLTTHNLPAHLLARGMYRMGKGAMPLGVTPGIAGAAGALRAVSKDEVAQAYQDYLATVGEP